MRGKEGNPQGAVGLFEVQGVHRKGERWLRCQGCILRVSQYRDSVDCHGGGSGLRHPGDIGQWRRDRVDAINSCGIERNLQERNCSRIQEWAVAVDVNWFLGGGYVYGFNVWDC